MSLYSVWVQCLDGWYADPVWEKTDESGWRKWFVCVDEDEPVEFVGFDGCQELPDFVKMYEPKWTRKGQRFAHTSFPEYKDAISAYVQFAHKPPTPQKFSDFSATKPESMMAYYEFLR